MKRLTNHLLFLLAACLLAGCASGPVVHTDQDATAALDRYRAYAWRQEPPIAKPLLKQRVVAAVDAELAGKGWRRVPEAEADVVLVGNVSVRDEQSIDAFYDGPDWTGWGWRGAVGPGPGLGHVEVRTYRIGTLVLDMFDVGTRQAVWRATAEGSVPATEARMNRDALAAVAAMFRDFPPARPTAP
jgi:hypothetical protein